MYKSWTSSASSGAELARHVEAHLNEFAEEIISVSYAVADRHYVLAVYRAVDPAAPASEEEAVSAAEHIIDQAGA